MDTDHEAHIAEGIEGIGEMEGILERAWLAGLTRYLRNRTETGSFLRAVLENDHSEAIVRAHLSVAMADMKALQTLLYNYFPADSFGSPQKVAAWLAQRSEQVV